MTPARQIASIWLRIPERGVDVLSIILASTGVNVATSSPGSHHALTVLLSGLAITASGVVMMLLKYRAAMIWRSVESRIDADRESVRRYVANEGIPRPATKSLSTHLKETIADVIEHSAESGPVVRSVLASVVLAGVGMAFAFWPVFVPESGGKAEVGIRLNAIDEAQVRLEHDIRKMSQSIAACSTSVELQTAAAMGFQEQLMQQLVDHQLRIEREMDQIREGLAGLARVTREDQTRNQSQGR